MTENTSFGLELWVEGIHCKVLWGNFVSDPNVLYIAYSSGNMGVDFCENVFNYIIKMSEFQCIKIF